jgi:hypothetical protein
MGTTCIHTNQEREIGITKSSSFRGEDCIEEENHLKMAA